MATLISGSFTTTGVSNSSMIYRNFNVSVQGTFVATVDLERSFDNGTTWEVVESYTAPVSKSLNEVEALVSYRLNCSAFTSGQVNYRIGSDGTG